MRERVRQKRPHIQAKETSHTGKRDLTYRQKRPHIQAKETSHTSKGVPMRKATGEKKNWKVAFFLKKKRPGLGPNAEPTPDGQEALLKPHVRPHPLLLRTACGAVRFVCVSARARMCIVCMCMCVHVHVCVRVYLCMYVSICMCVCLSVCTRMHMYTCVSICAHAYIHL
jgi:hypothetical protein